MPTLYGNTYSHNFGSNYTPQSLNLTPYFAYVAEEDDIHYVITQGRFGLKNQSSTDVTLKNIEYQVTSPWSASGSISSRVFSGNTERRVQPKDTDVHMANYSSVKQATSYTVNVKWTCSVTCTATSKTGGAASIKTLNITLNVPITISALPQYAVTFNANGGTPNSSRTVTRGNTVGSLPSVSRTGYTFAGWWTEASGGSQISASTQIYNTVTYYAHWTANTYTVRYNGNNATGGSTASSTHTYDVPKALTSNGFSRTGYTFYGWATTSTGSRAYTNGQQVSNLTTSGTIDLYAVWSANTYTVTLVQNGGSGGSNSVTAAYNANMPFATMPSRNGYTFGGYYDALPSGTRYYMPNGTSARTWNKTASTNLYASWSANTYTITFNTNGGSGGSSSVTATYNANMPSITPPTRNGYKFEGYYDTASGGTQYYTTSGTSARSWNKSTNTTLYAHWTSYYVTVRYNVNGGTVITGTGTTRWRASNGRLQRSVDSGNNWQDVTHPIYTYDAVGSDNTDLWNVGTPPIIKAGYHVDGVSAWNTQANGNGINLNQDYSATSTDNPVTAYVLNGNEHLTSNITVDIYPKWSLNTYNLKYDYNGGTNNGTTSTTIVVNDNGSGAMSTTDITDIIPYRDKYQFLGWSTSKTATTPTYRMAGNGSTGYTTTYTANNLSNGATVTLYAVWKNAYVAPVFNNLKTNRGINGEENDEATSALIEFQWTPGQFYGDSYLQDYTNNPIPIVPLVDNTSSATNNVGCYIGFKNHGTNENYQYTQLKLSYATDTNKLKTKEVSHTITGNYGTQGEISTDASKNYHYPVNAEKYLDVIIEARNFYTLGLSTEKSWDNTTNQIKITSFISPVFYVIDIGKEGNTIAIGGAAHDLANNAREFRVYIPSVFQDTISNNKITIDNKYITSTEQLYLQAGKTNTEDEKGFIISTDHFIIPTIANTPTNDVGYIGSSSNRWAGIYATTFYGALSGNATSATKATQDGSGNTITSTYLKLTGGTISGNLTTTGTLRANNILTLYREGTTAQDLPAGIIFSNKDTTTGQAYGSIIYTYSDHASASYGNQMVISPRGNLFIGSGEAAENHYDLYKNSGTEKMYITADEQIYIQAGGQTIANRKGFIMSADHYIIPVVADATTNNVGYIGSSSNRWAGIYAGLLNASGNINAIGNLYSGNASQTSERDVVATSGAGSIYLYTTGSSTGNRGIWGSNAAGTEHLILQVGQNNIVHLPSGTIVDGNFSSSGLLTSVSNGVTTNFGSQGSNFCHIYTDGSNGFAFNKSFAMVGNGTLGTSGYAAGGIFLTSAATIKSLGSMNLACANNDQHFYFSPGYLSCPACYSNTVSTDNRLAIASAGKIGRYASSSRRYKELIQDSKFDPHGLYNLHIRQFKYKDGYFSQDDDNPRAYNIQVGFIAEEVQECFPAATVYDKDQIESWEERKIIPPMLQLIQEQHKEIELLKEKITQLEGRLK